MLTRGNRPILEASKTEKFNEMYGDSAFFCREIVADTRRLYLVATRVTPTKAKDSIEHAGNSLRAEAGRLESALISARDHGC